MFHPLRIAFRKAYFLAKKERMCIQWKRSKRKWVTAESSALKNDPTRLALNHFDHHYRAQFGKDWPSIRLGLLSLQKYGALINNYCSEDEAIEKLLDLEASEFVQVAARRLRNSYNEKEMAAWKRKHFQSEGEISSSILSDECSSSDVNDVNSAKEENLDESVVNNDGRLELELGTTQRTSTNTKGQRSQDKNSWRDEYIVAAGFESKLEYMIGQDHIHDAPTPLDDVDVPIEIVDRSINTSTALKCFTFAVGNFQRFPPSRIESESGLLLYYLMDASSLLPVMALDIQPKDSVLDMCAAPGGKSLAMLGMLEEGGIVLNEPSTGRRRRLTSVLNSYLPDNILNSGIMQVTSVEGQQWGSAAPDTFDKILVDVPCTTDRLSLKEKDNNIFNPRRSKERWELPSLQEELLCSALLSVKPGGDVVYSTCSLSSLQNDGVIQGAISKCQEDYGMNIQVLDLSTLASSTKPVFTYSSTAKYGQLIVPDLTKNFGPMFFAKLRKISNGNRRPQVE